MSQRGKKDRVVDPGEVAELLRASGGPGGSSSGAKFGGKAVYNLLEKDTIRRLLKEGINVQGSGGQVYRFKNVNNPFVEARKRRC